MAKKYINKLIKYNLNHPIEKRISVEAIEFRRSQLERIVRLLKLAIQVRKEVEPLIEMQRALWDSLDGHVLGRETQGYVNEPGSSRLPIYQTGYMEPDLSANNSLGCRLTSSEVVRPEV